MTAPTTPHRPGPSAASASAASIPAVTAREEMEDATCNASSTCSAPHKAADDSGDEDEAPDYLGLLSTLNSQCKARPWTTTSSGIVIPKRGEKDFEPTGFGGQSKLLDRSREAMFTAVSGQRTIGSRSLVRAVWKPELRRARLLDVQGKIFETVGVIRRETLPGDTGKMVTKAINELLPEEALFLAERASLQLYTVEEQEREAQLVPMSLQQAFASLMLPPTEGEGLDEPLTREAYLVYAYLKRLGYVVQRAKVVDAVRSAPVSANVMARKRHVKSQGVVADPERPLKLVTIWDVLLYIPRRLAQLGGDAMGTLFRLLQWVWRRTMARFMANIAARVARGRGSARSLRFNLGLDAAKGGQDGRRFLGEKGNVRWDSYDAVFSSLQIVPSGHDFVLPNSTTTTTTTTTTLRPFYYAYRPATLYRKSHPPPPEFRIVILNARTHPLPSIWGFESIFAQIPVPGSDAELFSSTLPSTTCEGEKGMDAEQVRERMEYEKSLQVSNQAKNRAAYGKLSLGKQKFLREKAAARQAAVQERKQKQMESEGGWKKFWASSLGRRFLKVLLMDFGLLKVLARLFRHCPPGCWVENRARRGYRGKAKNAGAAGAGNVFPPLKAGRRSVVVAVVDGSITTLLRFGESEFARWALYGVQQQPGKAVEESKATK
ncbi:uncharacterized protein UBRO_07557 [Ustilago bromivora]|uniref:tRNA-splicing endonuclease subunit Sen54 N-terminal domain-containing protein n=1 Tax=Ustilago bromivora TaxID=307758 RepID=A0A1K0GAL3_9BASI|nr:uncharacterized protein UBRO_07557 [Ustilago bromivora]SYW80179.1 uncharacterized protein UBRO2_03447 [Ustilago bromivora]